MPNGWTNVSPYQHPSFVKNVDQFIVYRVNWLRAKARYDRCSEMTTILLQEMQCTTAWFAFQAEQWRERGAASPPEVRSYAARQTWLWDSFRLDAETRFRDAVPELVLHKNM